MTGPKKTEAQGDHFRLRDCILSFLYEMFKVHPFASIDVREIEEHCGVSYQELNWNLVYLEKCGYVELGKSIDFPPYVAASVTITAAGIDLTEDPAAFQKRFRSNA